VARLDALFVKGFCDILAMRKAEDLMTNIFTDQKMAKTRCSFIFSASENGHYRKFHSYKSGRISG
jgi:hypothetical protein